MDNLCVKDRVSIGKKEESNAINHMNVEYDLNLIPSTHYEDCCEKTDCWMKTKNGTLLRAAVKARLNKEGKLEKNRKDILVALYDPYYGIGNPNTKIGRDMLYEYALYISVISGQIRACKGEAIHRICKDLEREFVDRIGNHIPKGSGKPVLLMRSYIHEGCQIWLHYDAKARHPKLLAFISPDALKLNKEIKIYPYCED